MRRFQRLGLLKRSHLPRSQGPLSKAEKYVSEYHLRDLILYHRLLRASPHIEELEYAIDDADWKMEYYMEVLEKGFVSLLGWIMRPFQYLRNCFQKRIEATRKKYWNEKRCGGGDGGYGSDDDALTSSANLAKDSSSVRLPECMRKDAVSKVWRYKTCRPYLNRRSFKRKWLRKPETRDWAKDTINQIQHKVNHDFRYLRSGIGKDIKIYVISVASADPSCPTSSVITTSVFQADAEILKKRSQLFFLWLMMNEGGKKEIETSYVTPEEMEAILVYIYTSTWPTSMLVKEKGHKSTRISSRFFEILEIYGIPMNLTKRSPFASYSITDIPTLPFNDSMDYEDILADSFLPFPSLYKEDTSFHIINENDPIPSKLSQENQIFGDLSNPPSFTDIQNNTHRKLWRWPLRKLKSAHRIHPKSTTYSNQKVPPLRNPFPAPTTNYAVNN